MNNITYDIKDFTWNQETNTFYADAWNLDPINGHYLYAFPSQRQQFYIQNQETGNFRRFRFVKEQVDTVDIPSMEESYSCTITAWIFTSDDGILCNICIKED